MRLFFQFGCDEIKRIGDDRIQHGIGAGNIGAGTDRAEFKLIARESKGRSAVSVAGFFGKLGQNRNARLEHAALFAGLGAAFFDLLDNVVELIAQEDGDNRRRSLVGTQTMVVVGRRDRQAQNGAIFGDRPNDRGREDQKLGIVVRGVARLEQIFGIGAHRPVVVFAGSIDARKRFFVQQAD